MMSIDLLENMRHSEKFSHVAMGRGRLTTSVAIPKILHSISHSNQHMIIDLFVLQLGP